MIKPHNYKYNILAKLESQSVKKMKIAKNVLPLALKITPRSFKNCCYIKIGDRNNISPDKLQIIANYFKCKVDDLLNESVPNINYDRLLENYEKEQTKNLGL